MMLRFRPYPGFTVACAILFAILCGLGVWQLQRLHWKLALIADRERPYDRRAGDAGRRR